MAEMGGAGLTIVNGAEAGAWIEPRLEGGFGGKVEQLVPNGYDSYVRVFHALTDANGDPATWTEVAATCGRVAHREMQWHRLIGLDEPSTVESSLPYSRPGAEWGGSDPPTGEMDPVTLRALCTVLSRHTDDPDHCFFGLSTIYGGVEEDYSAAVPLHWRSRDFIVFGGPVDAAHQMGYEARNSGLVRFGDGPWERVPPSSHWVSQPPNLIWPADHSWFAQTDYDLDSTLVGGSRALVDDLFASPELETWEVERSDSLEAWADRIN
jgi:hypothetical protein